MNWSEAKQISDLLSDASNLLFELTLETRLGLTELTAAALCHEIRWRVKQAKEIADNAHWKDHHG